jgi:hypothetical protein
MNMLQLAEMMYAAEGIMLAAVGADVMVRYVSRITAKLLEWYPGGQMLAWGVSYQHMVAGRPGHMLAAASFGGCGVRCSGLCAITEARCGSTARTSPSPSRPGCT